MTLHDYLEAENQKARDYMEAHPGSWVGTTTTDEKHWNEYGVYTVEDYERYILIATLWDGYKDLTGCRPRWMNFNDMTKAELENELEKLKKQFEEEEI